MKNRYFSSHGKGLLALLNGQMDCASRFLIYLFDLLLDAASASKQMENKSNQEKNYSRF